MKKLTILSTFHENIGDDLIRSGVEEVLTAHFNGEIEKVYVTKSNPLSMYADWGKVSHAPRWQKEGLKKRVHDALVRRVPSKVKTQGYESRILDADALLVAGTPLFYFTRKRFTFLQNGFWAKEVIQPFLDAGKPVFVVGAGFLLDDAPEAIAQRCPEEIAFLKNLIEKSRYFGVRDGISYDFLSRVIPNNRAIQTHCPSLWNTPLEFERVPKSVNISLSLESARIDKNPKTAIAKRMKVFESVLDYLRKEGFERIQLTSHNQVDFETQMGIYKKYNLPKPFNIPSGKMRETFGSASLLVTWRVHGAMAARLMDTPTVLFKTDNRYKMAEEVGAFVLDDREDTPEEIVSAIDRFLKAEEKPASVDETRVAKEKEQLKQSLEKELLLV